MDREILHISLVSFFAAVERMRRPDLSEKASLSPRPRGSARAVVVSASGEARKLGVENAMTVRQVRYACPNAEILKADFAAYRQVFNGCLDVLARYSPLLEPSSIGGAYLDVTGSRAVLGDVSDIAAKIASEISEGMGLSGHHRLRGE